VALHGPLLTLRDAAALLGWPATRVSARRLLRYLAKRAPAALVRPVASSTRPYYTTARLLGHHCPEFFLGRDELGRLAAEHVAELRESLAEQRLAYRSLVARIRSLEHTQVGRTASD